MIEIESNALLWCREQLGRKAGERIIVTMYKDGVDGGFELGVSLLIGNEAFTIPLSYFTSELSNDAYRAYSWLIDDYARFLTRYAIPNRRIIAEFEP